MNYKEELMKVFVEILELLKSGIELSKDQVPYVIEEMIRYNLTIHMIFTVISVMLFVVFLKQRKKPRFKLPATVCVLSSAVGTSLAWLAYVVDMYQKEAFYLSLKLKTYHRII